MVSMFGWENNILTSELTASSAATGLSAGNLAREQGNPAEAWQTAAGVTSAYFQATTYNAASRWRLVTLHRTNLTPSATVRVRVGNVSMTATTYDSGVQSGTISAGILQHVTVIPSTVTGACLRIDIADVNNPDGFINVPLAYGGPVSWQPGRNYDHASTSGRTSSESVVVARSGTEFVTPMYQQRHFNLTFSALTEDEVWSFVGPLIRFAHTGANVLLVPNWANAQVARTQTVYGRLRSLSDISYPRAGFDVRAWRGVITERL